MSRFLIKLHLWVDGIVLDVLRQYLCCFCHVLHRQIAEVINSLFVTAVKSVTLSIGCSDVIGQHTFLRNLQVLVLLLLGRLQRSNLCAELTLDCRIGLSTSQYVRNEQKVSTIVQALQAKSSNFTHSLIKF